MEFPTDQLTAALVARTGLLPLEACCRLTNIAYFYLSAWFLYLLCQRFLPATGASQCVVVCYVWLPYTLVWSRTAMIDYTAVALGLGYLYWFLRWLEGDRRAVCAGAAILFGGLGFATKVMSMTMIVLSLACCLAWHAGRLVRAAGGLRNVCRVSWLRRAWPGIFVGLIMLLIPLLAGWQWIRYADRVKSRTSITAQFVSSSLIIKLDITSPYSTLLAFYYLTEGQADYDDNHIAVARVEPGRNVIYRKIPARGLRGQLRFDPARCPGGFVLHELEIVAVPP